MTVGFTNKSIYFRRLQRALKEKQRDIEEAFEAEMELVLTEAKDQVPVKTGSLRRSGTMENQSSSRYIKIIIGFNMKYAAAVHEIEKNYNFGKSWKYLENPFNAAIPNLLENVAKRAKLEED